MKGAEYCFFHNPAPEVVSKRLEARRHGGSNKGKVRVPKSLAEVKELLARGLADAVSGRISKSDVAGLAHLGQVTLRAFELADLHSRLEKVGV